MKEEQEKKKTDLCRIEACMKEGKSAETQKIKKSLLSRVGGGEVQMYLPERDRWAAPSPAGVVCQCSRSSHREFHAFHLRRFDVETVRCCCVFLPHSAMPHCWLVF